MSGRILGTLAEVCPRNVDLAGVVDDTQVDGVLCQWRMNGARAGRSRAPPLAEAARFSGKRSTPWGPTLHDFMHAKWRSQTMSPSSAGSTSLARARATRKTCSRSVTQRPQIGWPCSWTRSAGVSARHAPCRDPCSARKKALTSRRVVPCPAPPSRIVKADRQLRGR